GIGLLIVGVGIFKNLFLNKKAIHIRKDRV
ncbi:TPA: EamA-like transporter family protein, partial [Bacillus cereus]